eukprot:2462501-Pleurochrysis_carterae.AAC.1
MEENMVRCRRKIHRTKSAFARVHVGVVETECRLSRARSTQQKRKVPGDPISDMRYSDKTQVCAKARPRVPLTFLQACVQKRRQGRLSFVRQSRDLNTARVFASKERGSVHRARSCELRRVLTRALLCVCALCVHRVHL